MKNSFATFVISASMAMGMGAVAANPAQAGSLTGITIGGTAASDYLVYGSDGTNTFLVPNTPGNVAAALTGDAGNPTGNVELRASSEQLSGFDFNNNTTLSGQIGGQDITLSSLTFADWFSTDSGINTSYGANNLANRWFNDFWVAAGQVTDDGLQATAFNTFLGINGFQRTSDPNISYVNQDHNTGLIRIGLAGHLNLKAAYLQSGFSTFAQLLPDGFQASEVVKYTYNGVTDYLYSFTATNSGLVSDDGTNSHNGNYEVTIQGVPTAKTPEPSVVLGMLGVAGIVAAQRKLKKAAVSD
ncbi:MAG: hypothetical protein RLZZ507_534 [Cyanobacteriota bacterium]|jgi:hypothetical protein